MFDGFDEFYVDTADTLVHGRSGGTGPPLLLLHGIPETHLMWHRVAPQLAENFTVVVTDLRGYGDSSAPPSDETHSPYSMRALAAEQVRAMHQLGYDSFGVVGHDRGARCAYRMALDHPDVVTKLAVLDIVPTGHAFENADMAFALGYWVWSFLAAPEPVPENLIGSAPEAFVDYMLDDWSSVADSFPAVVREAYIEQFRDPQRRHAICEQYRAAATLDVEHDRTDLGSTKVECPTLALWSRGGPVDSWYDPVNVWQQWAADVRGSTITGGHFMPEEAPDEVVAALEDFLR